MEKLEYAATLIERVHMLQGKLKWQVDKGWISVNPTQAIHVTINYEDDGPDSVVWESVMVRHPVGKGTTILGNPASSMARLYEPASGQTLDLVNEILDPWKKQFEAAMEELSGL